MKRTALLISLIITLLTACNNSGRHNNDLDQLYQQINDSLQAGNLTFAKEAITRGLAEAKDSDEYYSFMVKDIVADYYAAQPDSMIAKLKRTESYLSREPRNDARDLLRVKCYETKGALYTQYIYDTDSMLHYQKAAADLSAQGSDPTEYLISLGNLADAYKFAGDLAHSVMSYREALMLADSIHAAPESYVTLYSGIASTFTALRDFEQSGLYWNRLEKLWGHMMPYERFSFLTARGNDYFYKGENEMALKTFCRLDSVLTAPDFSDWERRFNDVNLAAVYLKLKQPGNAQPLIDRSITYFNDVQPNPTALNYLHTLEMDMAAQRGDYALVDRLIAEYPDPMMARTEQGLLRFDFLRQYYPMRGDYKKAYEIEKTFHELDDSLRSERVLMKASETTMRFERDKTVLSQQLVIRANETKVLWLTVILAIVVIVVMAVIFWSMLRRRKEKIHEQQMMNRIVTMKMDNARNRITPHFIYNALNHELLARREGRPSEMHKLVDLLRQGQKMAAEFTTTLRKEIEFIDLYVSVEQMALGNFDYSVKIDGDINLDEVILPSMTLQIFVENALKHGLSHLPDDAEKRLEIRAFRSGGAITVEVLNNGPEPGEDSKCSCGLPATSVRDKTRSGLRIVTQVIQLLNTYNKQKMTFALTSGREFYPQSCCKASLVIPDGYSFQLP